MAPEPPHNPVSPDSLARGYEPEAVPARGIARAIPLFAVALIGLQGALWWYMKSVGTDNTDLDAPRSVARESINPPPPNLQPSVAHDSTPADDMEGLRQQEDAIFRKLGWDVDPRNHRVVIPAEIAREVAAAQRARRPGTSPPAIDAASRQKATTAPAATPKPEGGNAP